MADPTTVTLADPAGIELADGYQTLIGFGEDTDISLWVHEVTPPGVEGGEPIDQTSMHNSTWITKIAQALLDLEPLSAVVGYDPDAYDECIAICNKDDSADSSITLQFPDGSTLDFWGYMRSFKPQRLVRNTKPMADIVLVPTNFDPVNRLEVGPVMTEVAGT